MWEHFHSIYLCSIYYISRPQSYPCYFAVHFFLLLWRCLLLECWIVFLYAFYVVLSSLYRFLLRFILYLPRCTQPNVPPVSSLASLPFLSCSHRTITFPDGENNIYLVFASISSYPFSLIYFMNFIFRYVSFAMSSGVFWLTFWYLIHL